MLPRSTILAGCILLCAPVARADSKIEHVVVKVEAANDEWIATPIKLAPGDLLVTSADGVAKVGQYLGNVGPDGLGNGTGSLQMKMGTTTVRRIGKKALITGESGVVKLRVQDSEYTDNSGGYQVHLLRIPADLIPEAQHVE
jgi:hypothetical protein